MMLKYSFGLDDASACIENAVARVLDKGFRTGDIASRATDIVGTNKWEGL
jgi:3-isopropylmalate dehydrogenase